MKTMVSQFQFEHISQDAKHKYINTLKLQGDDDQARDKH